MIRIDPIAKFAIRPVRQIRRLVGRRLLKTVHCDVLEREGVGESDRSPLKDLQARLVPRGIEIASDSPNADPNIERYDLAPAIPAHDTIATFRRANKAAFDIAALVTQAETAAALTRHGIEPLVAIGRMQRIKGKPKRSRHVWLSASKALRACLGSTHSRR